MRAELSRIRSVAGLFGLSAALAAGSVCLSSPSRGAVAEPKPATGSSNRPSPPKPAEDHSRHQPQPSTAAKSKGAQKEGEPPAAWFPGGSGLFVPPFYDSFTNLDLRGLDATQHERFLHWVNTEYCSCAQQGCRRDTVANCYTNDAQCPRAPVRIREILERVKKGDSAPGASQPAMANQAVQPPR